MPMTDEEKIRFTNDLYSIKNDTKGKDVKDSIHDALTLVGKYSGEGGGGGNEPSFAFVINTIAAPYIIGDAEVIPEV